MDRDLVELEVVLVRGEQAVAAEVLVLEVRLVLEEAIQHAQAVALAEIMGEVPGV